MVYVRMRVLVFIILIASGNATLERIEQESLMFNQDLIILNRPDEKFSNYNLECVEPIDHCKDMGCTKCDSCIDDNIFYKRTNSNLQCELMCSYKQTKCWPGSCVDGLAKNCQCDSNFTKSGGMCQLGPDTRPNIETCQTTIHGMSGETKQTPGGQTCSDLKDFYGNFQPSLLKFDMTSELKISTTHLRVYPYIHESKFGVTDTTVRITKKPVSGHEIALSNHPQKVDSGNSLNVATTSFSKGVTINLDNPMYSLTNGERLCMNFEANGGGYVKGSDPITHIIQTAEPYYKTVSTKVICYRYDGTPPQHCLLNGNCSTSFSEPIQISQRIIRYPMIQVKLEGWYDPFPPKGNSEHASGIESYTLTVNEVADGLVSTSKIFDVTINKTKTSTTLNLTSADGKPKLYSILLEVKDIADNVQQSRRFVLFDETTNISVDSEKAFHVTSASTETNYVWQSHHNEVCLDWKDYFYNGFYKVNSVLGRIKSHDGINGIYEQQSGVLPVSGTPNVHGITSFTFSWSVDNGTLSSEILVPNFLNQTYCHSLPLKDGQTYLLNIRATDIVNNTYIDSRTIHIDRSVPHINNVGLEKNGMRRLFAHGNTDLAKMSITFEVMDQHSGIQNVKWMFGTTETSILGTGVVAPDTVINHCPANASHCYCPDVGSCEKYKYFLSLNKLVCNGTNEGQHNRPYYFTIEATNNAKLINVEHLDILVDDSPPVKGVVLEGTIGSNDIDFTSEDEVMINWHGFIDHESGIKEYHLAFGDKCLYKEDLFKEDGSDVLTNYTSVPFTESSVRLVANFTGKRYTSIVAINNAMEASDVACSDGITRDKSPPSINNLRIQHARWSESLYCKNGIAWLFSSDLTKSILPSSRVCSKQCQLNFPESDMFDVLPTEPSLTNDSDILDFHCLNLPRFNNHNIIYLPNNHLSLLWSTENVGSQIDDFYIGIGEGISLKATIMGFKATHMNGHFKIGHLGVGSGQTFYVHIRSVNKANIERTTVVGPILIDETPPVIRSQPVVNIDKDWVTVGWGNDTFYDNEQKSGIDQIYFEIVHDGKVMTPLLEWRTRDSTPCPDFSGGCFKYPLKRMQNMDTGLGLNFTFNVHAFNHAGHFTKTETGTFILPSRYPPGQAVVLDIDPELVNGILKDTNIHFTSQRMCASWTGFRHHEKVNLMIGIGTTPVDANVVNFTMLKIQVVLNV